ncbi:hypothetical protein BST61_g3745 [Cercospora zeina]
MLFKHPLRVSRHRMGIAGTHGVIPIRPALGTLRPLFAVHAHFSQALFASGRRYYIAATVADEKRLETICLNLLEVPIGWRFDVIRGMVLPSQEAATATSSLSATDAHTDAAQTANASTEPPSDSPSSHDDAADISPLFAADADARSDTPPAAIAPTAPTSDKASSEVDDTETQKTMNEESLWPTSQQGIEQSKHSKGEKTESQGRRSKNKKLTLEDRMDTPSRASTPWNDRSAVTAGQTGERSPRSASDLESEAKEPAGETEPPASEDEPTSHVGHDEQHSPPLTSDPTPDATWSPADLASLSLEYQPVDQAEPEGECSTPPASLRESEATEVAGDVATLSFSNRGYVEPNFQLHQGSTPSKKARRAEKKKEKEEQGMQ